MESVWDRPRVRAGELLPSETVEFEGITMTVRRRKLAFSAEADILRRSIDPTTRQRDLKEMLAVFLELGGVAESDFGLTPARVRALDDDTELVWFLNNWLLVDLMKRSQGTDLEAARKKSGAPSKGAPPTPTRTKPSRAPRSGASALRTPTLTP
jgi:hypothetical protein